ncbi:MAG: hypothetical protein R3C99_08645 [Pirellulaceae bacterium]
MLRLLFQEFPPAYREFHRDLLFHQDNETLFNAFAMGRAAEVILAQGGPWTRHRGGCRWSSGR